MAKFIILFFIIIGGAVGYLTYTGTGQEAIETLEKEKQYSSSSRSGSWGGSSSYNSGGYSYGK